MKRYLITVPIELSLQAENEQDARVELLKVKSEIRDVYYLEKTTVVLYMRTEKAKVKELAF